MALVPKKKPSSVVKRQVQSKGSISPALSDISFLHVHTFRLFLSVKKRNCMDNLQLLVRSLFVFATVSPMLMPHCLLFNEAA